MRLKATPSRKVPQTPASTTSKWGKNREERAALLRVRTGPSRKVPQTPASTTSKWGQNREEQAALLRVRTRPECPEDDQRELL